MAHEQVSDVVVRVISSRDQAYEGIPIRLRPRHGVRKSPLSLTQVHCHPGKCGQSVDQRSTNMNHQFRLPHANSGIVAIVLACAFITHLSAGPIPFGEFLEFSFTTVGAPAIGCDPADPTGPFCIPSGGTPTAFLTAPPWTFVAPTDGATLTLTDAFTSGDRFQVFDFGASLGLTSLPTGGSNCGSDPGVCLGTAGISSGTFSLAAGNHFLTITPTLTAASG